MTLINFLYDELDYLESEKPDYGPGYNLEEFDWWSTKKWIVKQIIKETLSTNTDVEEAICHVGFSMKRYFDIATDYVQKDKWYDAYCYCEYLHDVYQNILINMIGDNY